MDALHVTVPNELWRPAREDDPSRPHLTGPTLVVNGMPMHLEAWRVETDGRGTQDAVDADLARDYLDLHNAVHADGPFRTTRIGEFDYIIVASPHCD